jgi:hypothetical protein
MAAKPGVRVRRYSGTVTAVGNSKGIRLNPDRYRLFFRFVSTPVELIVYVWF